MGVPFSREVTAHKIWQTGLWWPTVNKDAAKVAKECDVCQRLGQPTEAAWMPHQPTLALEPFQNWELDFVGPFNPLSIG